MLVSHADAEVMKRRERVLQDRPALEEAELLWTACCQVAIRLMSDEVAAYNACPSARCRRHRRCAGGSFRCGPIIRERGTPRDIVRLIDGLYWTMLPQLADGRPLDEAPSSEQGLS